MKKLNHSTKFGVVLVIGLAIFGLTAIFKDLLSGNLVRMAVVIVGLPLVWWFWGKNPEIREFEKKHRESAEPKENNE